MKPTDLMFFLSLFLATKDGQENAREKECWQITWEMGNEESFFLVFGLVMIERRYPGYVFVFFVFFCFFPCIFCSGVVLGFGGSETFFCKFGIRERGFGRV